VNGHPEARARSLQEAEQQLHQSAVEREGLRQRGATVVGVVIAGVLAIVLLPGPYDFGSTMIGAVLLAVLVGYGTWPHRPREAVGFAAAAALTLVLLLGLPLDRMFNFTDWPPGKTRDSYAPWWDHGWPELTGWLIFFCAILIYWQHRPQPPAFFRHD